MANCVRRRRSEIEPRREPRRSVSSYRCSMPLKKQKKERERKIKKNYRQLLDLSARSRMPSYKRFSGNAYLLNGGSVILGDRGRGNAKREESHRRRALGYLAFTSTIHFAQRLFKQTSLPLPALPLVLQALDACTSARFYVSRQARTHASRAYFSRARGMK